jgi:type IX secretion system PorP/SprF family membrane protein
MRKVLVAALLLVSGLSVNAQQEYQVSHNMFNIAAINPGAAGIDNAICGQLIGRQQWMGFDGAPQTYILNVNANLGVFNMPDNIGAGLTMYQDIIGAGFSTTAKLSGNYQLELANGAKLGLGIDLGIISAGIDPTQLNASQAGDNTLYALLNSNSTVTGSTFTGGVGSFYKASNLYFGVSTSQILESETVHESATIKLSRHYYITGGYETKPFMGGDMVLKPSIFIKTDGAVTTMDAAVIGEYQSLIWLGASYRTGDAIIAMTGLNINKLKVGLAYDFTTSDISTTSSSGSAELFLRYCHSIEVKTKKRIFVDPSLLQ